MKSPLFFSFILLLPLFIAAQTRTQQFSISKTGVSSLLGTSPDFAPSLFCVEKPIPSGGTKNKIIYQKKSSTANEKKESRSTLPPMALGKNFFGNAFGNSTPNDNDLAISNSGKLVSVINTSLFYYDVNTDSILGTQSYDNFVSTIGLYNEVFDPKIIYDQNEDRFITVILNGFADTSTAIIVGFSQSNDPTGLWNLYLIPGNPFGENVFSDYPMIALTEHELFLTINLVYADSTWQTGFDETLIWQIKKMPGYNGANLSTAMHSGIEFNGKPIRNLCPVRGGSALNGPDMYFLSNKNFAVQSDTIFLVRTTDTIGGGNFSIDIKQLNSDADYFLAGDARQISTHVFATNDSRILGGFLENNKIQFVSNSMDTNTAFCAVYHGIIDNPSSASPVVSGKIFGDSIRDLGYPNIAYAGDGAADNSAVISVDHTAPTVKPGCSAFKCDGNFNYTPLLKVADGSSSYVNVLSSPQERWGDYTGIQLKYDNPGEVWMSGYFAYKSGFNFLHRAYIGQILSDSIANTASLASLENVVINTHLYPNPSNDFFSFEFELSKTHYLNFELYNMEGKLVRSLMREWVRPGKNKFTFRTIDLAPGQYLLQVNHQGNSLFSAKVLKQ